MKLNFLLPNTRGWFCNSGLWQFPPLVLHVLQKLAFVITNLKRKMSHSSFNAKNKTKLKKKNKNRLLLIISKSPIVHSPNSLVSLRDRIYQDQDSTHCKLYPDGRR